MINERRRGLPYVLVAAVLTLATAVHAQENEARVLVRKALEAMPRQSFSARVDLSSPDFETRRLAMHRKYVGDTHGTYIEVIAPETFIGVRLLFLEKAHGPNEQYIKVAFSRSSVLVADEIRKQPFLNSTFYVYDLVLPDLDDFTYSLVGETEILGRKCIRVEATAKDPQKDIYSKSILAIDARDRLILRREFFDEAGQPFKVWEVEKLQKIDGVWTFSEQKMTNLADEKTSRLEVAEIMYNVELADEMFAPQYLLR